MWVSLLPDTYVRLSGGRRRGAKNEHSHTHVFTDEFPRCLLIFNIVILLPEIAERRFPD